MRWTSEAVYLPGNVGGYVDSGTQHHSTEDIFNQQVQVRTYVIRNGIHQAQGLFARVIFHGFVLSSLEFKEKNNTVVTFCCNGHIWVVSAMTRALKFWLVFLTKTKATSDKQHGIKR